MHGLANIGILRAKLTHLPTIAVCVVFIVLSCTYCFITGFCGGVVGSPFDVINIRSESCSAVAVVSDQHQVRVV